MNKTNNNINKKWTNIDDNLAIENGHDPSLLIVCIQAGIIENNNELVL